jgi:methylmalonyl-CoA mutase
MALENDVHIVGVSTLAAGHKVLVPELLEALRQQGGEDILVVVGGVVPPPDQQVLKDAGVAAIYPPGTNIPEAAREILKLLRARRKERAA